MKHLSTIFRIAAATALFASAPFALAHDNVSWSVSVGGGRPAPVYAPPAAVYVEPQPVYMRPAPVYVRPAPVYVQPATIVQYSSPYYVEEGYYRHGHHWKHHRHHDRD
jgi:hypothetical protein